MKSLVVLLGCFVIGNVFAAAPQSLTLGKAQSRQQLVPNENTKILTKRLAKITQNIDNPWPANFYLWNRKLGISGLLNLDANYQNNYNFIRKERNFGMLSVAKLNFDLDLTPWIHSHVGLFGSSENNKYYPAQFKVRRIEADEAYITVANLSKSPFYFRFGKQYLPFSNYHRYPIFKTLTQQLAETRGCTAQIGYLDFHGIYCSVYAFNGATHLSKMNKRDNSFNNGGIALGYVNLNSPVGFDVGVGYLNNMADVGAIRRDLISDYYQNRVGGMSAHVDAITGPFDFAVRYVTAMKRFNLRDFAYQTNSSGNLTGAEPSAAALTAGYAFKTKGHDSKFVLGYQWSGEAYNLSSNASNFTRLPRWRISMGYGVEFCPHVILGAEFTRDRDYPVKHGGTNGFNHTVSVRASAYF